jgi:hypothetical protein
MGQAILKEFSSAKTFDENVCVHEHRYSERFHA